MTAVAAPIGPVALTRTVVVAGMAVGATYSPVELIVPALADQVVAPAEMNCCVWPSVTETVAGVIVCVAVAMNVTAASADPLGPLARIAVVELAGMVEGAV